MQPREINPAIPGFAPDPSIDRIGDTYFLVNSTFHMFPGLPVYASKDLINWTHIGNAINRQEQLSLRLSDTKLHDEAVMLATGGLFAPTIRHNSKSGKTYVINTNVIHPEDGGPDICENFIVSTDDPFTDKWSDPVWFDFRGIDPSIFWDENDKAYVCGSRGPGPMTTINLFEIDLDTGKKLTEEKTIWTGTGGIFPEGPHIYQKDGWFYLMISEGGTFQDHMITIARSKDIWGPYESNPANPILTARGTSEYIQCTGHVDVIQDPTGAWWGWCLAMRMKDKRFMMGRESFVFAMDWPEGEWPTMQQVVMKPERNGSPLKAVSTTSTIPESKNDVSWLYIRDCILDNHRITGPNIELVPSHADLSQWQEPVTFVGKRQRKLDGYASVTLELPSSKVCAGLVNYKDEHRYIRVFVDTHKNELVFEFVNKSHKISRRNSVTLPSNKSIDLYMQYTEMEIELGFIDDNKTRQKLGEVDVRDMSNADFVGPVIGLFATSETSKDIVTFLDLKVDQ